MFYVLKKNYNEAYCSPHQFYKIMIENRHDCLAEEIRTMGNERG